jgi:hypothetical protein
MSDQAEQSKPAEQAPAPGMRKVTDEEMRAAFGGPAVHANRFFLSTLAGGLRLSFTEQHGARVAPQFRTAVIIDFAAGIALRNLLNRHLKEFEEFLEQEQKAAADAQSKKDG